MTIGDLEFEVNLSAASSGKLEVRCVADVFQAYRTEAKVILVEERPRLASVLGTRESSTGTVTNTFRYYLFNKNTFDIFTKLRTNLKCLRCI